MIVEGGLKGNIVQMTNPCGFVSICCVFVVYFMRLLRGFKGSIVGSYIDPELCVAVFYVDVESSLTIVMMCRGISNTIHRTIVLNEGLSRDC